jgi:hypothetical protein
MGVSESRGLGLVDEFLVLSLPGSRNSNFATKEPRFLSHFGGSWTGGLCLAQAAFFVIVLVHLAFGISSSR